MVKPLVEPISLFFNKLLGFLPPGLGIAVATAFIEGGNYLRAWRHEFIGTLLMICCTFSAGKWIGSQDLRMAWTSHLLGVIAADYFGGGPQVNPAVTVAMWALGRVTYTEAYVRISGQLAGGLVAFPLYHAISETLSLEPFGGPEFNMKDGEEHPVDAFCSEYMATLLLLFAIYILNFELHFGQYHYIIKQALTAVAIRALIESFPTAGPAMNPMLATSWAVFGVGTTFEYPKELNHYIVYWVAPFMAAVTSAILYSIYAGGKVFGFTLPLGPFKPAAPPAKKVLKGKKKN